VITTDWDWRGIFLVNVPVGVFALAVTLWQVAESRSPDAAPPDWPGFALLTTGLIALVYGLIRAGENSWSDPGVIACLAGGAALLAAFLVVEGLTSSSTSRTCSATRRSARDCGWPYQPRAAGHVGTRRRFSQHVPARWLIGPACCSSASAWSSPRG